MGLFGRNKDQSCAERLNMLESRLERLELDHAERQVTVLKTAETVLNQLRAIEQQRRRRESADKEPGDPQVTDIEEINRAIREGRRHGVSR